MTNEKNNKKDFLKVTTRVFGVYIQELDRLN